MSIAINDLVQTGIDLAMSLTTDIQDTVDYFSQDTPAVYVPETGVVVPPTATKTGIKAISSTFESENFNGRKVKTGDKLLIFRQTDLGFAPTSEDFMEIGGIRWDIITFEEVPTRLVWLIMARVGRGKE